MYIYINVHEICSEAIFFSKLKNSVFIDMSSCISHQSTASLFVYHHIKNIQLSK